MISVYLSVILCSEINFSLSVKIRSPKLYAVLGAKWKQKVSFRALKNVKHTLLLAVQNF